MKNKVLIKSVGRKVSLIRAFQEAGWKVYGHDDDVMAIGLRACDEVYIGQAVDLVVPTRDAELPDAEPFNTCRDKFAFYKWCKANGFKSPEVYFVKPRVSSSGKEVECVWQELVGGREYSIDLFVDFNGNVISVVPRERLKTVNGESCITRTVRSEILIEQSKSLAEKLGLIGHNCLQAFMGEDGVPVWTDVNCRFGGASIVGIKAGCLSPTWLLKLINGESVEPCIGDYKIITGMSYTNWEFYED